MKLILLSGGSGKRLWPLSNDFRSKQFVKVLRNEAGEHESMVQRVWRQLGRVGLAEHAYIATGRAQADVLQSQIGIDTPIIIEPERRDTFPAIALAATYLYSQEGISIGETVAVLPVDPYVDDAFFSKIKTLEAVLASSKADLALMGVRPDGPSEKYGYIVPEESSTPFGHRCDPLPYESLNQEMAPEEQNDFFTVGHFIEKPDEQRAAALIGQQALWNCGVFAFKLDYLINLLARKGLPIQYEAMLSQYHRLPSISFDYEVVEKAGRIVAASYEGSWKDLGTWNTLTEEVEASVTGHGTVSADSHNTHIINELDIPVAVLGLSNVIVSSSPDGILVADKSASPRLKEFIKPFEQRPMYEERRWGSYRVLDYKKFPDGHEVLTKRICVAAGKNLSYQLHFKRSEVWTIIAGEGEFVLNDQLFSVKAGDTVKIPAGARHSIRASIDLEIIEVQSGTELVEEDIIRLCLAWDEIVKLCGVARRG
ncbi:sugar phosphate nucleotidyltransferase [Paenibacillus sp. y28]|uniref:sugar phosphate nucleotidyltransferase n=1 Tax=Paenibacillus sp. y28 TaxID=3129110 RepID=UPI003017FA67